MFNTEQEGRGYNRSEMPLDALGCTRNTIAERRKGEEDVLMDYEL